MKLDELSSKQMIFPAENPLGAVVIYLEIDNRKCEITRDVECFSSATGVSVTLKTNNYSWIMFINNFVYSLF